VGQNRPLTLVRRLGPFTSSFALEGPIDAAFFDKVYRDSLHRLVGRGDGIIIGLLTDDINVYRMMSNLHSMSAGRTVPRGTEIGDDDLPKDVQWAVMLTGVNIGSSKVTHEGSQSVVYR
jgi:hypothetical protein